MKPAETVYLGDSVYASCNGNEVEIHTDNGFGPQNTIYLEVEVVAALVGFLARVGVRAREEP